MTARVKVYLSADSRQQGEPNMYKNSSETARAHVTKESAEKALNVFSLMNHRPGMEQYQRQIALCIESRESALAEANRTLSR